MHTIRAQSWLHLSWLPQGTPTRVSAKVAAEALGHLNQVKPLNVDEKSAAVDALVKLLHDADAEVAGTAIESLAALGDQRAVEPIIGLLENAKLGTKAVVALARFHDQRAETTAGQTGSEGPSGDRGARHSKRSRVGRRVGRFA